MDSKYNDAISFDATVSPEGIVELTLGGNASAYLHEAELQQWVNNATSMFEAQMQKQGGRALSLVDVSTLRDFDERAMEIVKNFAANPILKNVKTAVIGGTLFSNMALRTIIVMTGRKNIKSFSTKDEALAWLNDSGVAA